MIVKFLGSAQDAGIPQIGCQCKLCKEVRKDRSLVSYPVSLGIFNSVENKKYIFEATPKFSEQFDMMQERFNSDDNCANTNNTNSNNKLDGIFLTHAHLGHYTGLLSLGKEALNSFETPVFASHKMKEFLENNAPWEQLVIRKNIKITPFENNKSIELDSEITVTPIEVPHRNEYADTFGFIITDKRENKSVFFLPDLDTWEPIIPLMNEIFKKCDYAILDSTFYTKDEIAILRDRDPKEIPHPSVKETVKLIEDGIFEKGRCKIVLSHFNHTNLILHDSKIKEELEKKDYIISFDNMELFND